MLRFGRIIYYLTRYLLVTAFSPRHHYNLKNKAILFRQTLENLGGVFVKFGQLLALRVDLLPIEFNQELILLFDRVSPFPFYQVENIFYQETGFKLKDKFTKVNSVPLAAGSFAQVHQAILLTGEEVVIKVQRPNIEKEIKGDLAILSFFVYLLSPIINIDLISLKEILKEFKRWTKLELDFQQEARSCQKIRENLKDSETFVIPKIYSEFTTKHIIVQEFIAGLPFTTVLKDAVNNRLDQTQYLKDGFDIPKLTYQIVYEMSRQFFIDGIYHADPHPGNIILMENGKIGLVDFGIVATVNSDIKNFYKFIESTVVYKDLKGAAYFFLQFTSLKFIKKLKLIFPADEKNKNIETLVETFAQNYFDSLKELEGTMRGQLARKEIEYTTMVLKIARFGERYNVRLNPDMVTFLRALSFLGIEMKIIHNNFRLNDILRDFISENPINKICYSGPNEIEVVPSLERAVEDITSWISSLPEKDISLYQRVYQYLKLNEVSLIS